MKVKRKKKKSVRLRKDGKVHAKPGPKNKLGSESLKKIEQLAKVGLTEEQISSILGVHFSTWMRNKKSRVEIRNVIKRGLQLGNKKIQGSMFKRANGFTVKAVHLSAYKGDITRTEYDKYYPPSDIAAIYWLKNKAGWKDKPDDVFDQQAVMSLAQKLVEIIVSEAPNEKTRQKMLSRINDAFETLQSKRSGGPIAQSD